MITTDCEKCCFLKRHDQDSSAKAKINRIGKECALGQMCILENKRVFAPGCCRFCRSNGWIKRQDITELKELCKRIIEECTLEFDMLVFFDEEYNTIEDLKRTLDSDWYSDYAKKIIIMDTTGFGDRKNLALQYLRGPKQRISTVVDSSFVHEPIADREKTLRRVSKQITSPFFLAISTGNTISPKHFETFAQMIKYVPSRVVHWSFPHRVGLTLIISHFLNCGLFMTKPYLRLLKLSSNESFTEILRKEEVKTKMGLSLLYTGAQLI